MNSLKLEKLGMEYCKKQDKCHNCRLLKHAICINQYGKVGIKVVEGMTFTSFAKDFNFMLKEIGAIETPEKPCISPKYLRQELEQLALDQEQKMLEHKPEIDKSAMMYEIYMKGVNMAGEYQGCWVRFKEIEQIVDKYVR